MDTLTRKYQPTDFESGALKKSSDELERFLEGGGWKVNICGQYASADGLTTRKSLSTVDLDGITNVTGSLKSLSFDCIRDKELQSTVSIQGWPDCLTLVTSAANANQCKALNDVFAKGLALEEATESAPAVRPAASAATPSDAPAASSAQAATEPRSLGWVCANMPASGWFCIIALAVVAFALGTLV